MQSLGLKPLAIRDKDHMSRTQLVFEDEFGQYRTRVIILDYENDDESMGGLVPSELEGVKGETCFECGQNPSNEYAAEEAECVRKILDDKKVPKELDGKPLSLVGRVLYLGGQLAPELEQSEVLCPMCNGRRFEGQLKFCHICKGTGKEKWFAASDRERQKAYPFLKEPCPCGADLAIYTSGGRGPDRSFSVACRGLGCENGSHSAQQTFKVALDAVGAWNTRMRKEQKEREKQAPKKRKPLKRRRGL